MLSGDTRDIASVRAFIVRKPPAQETTLETLKLHKKQVLGGWIPGWK